MRKLLLIVVLALAACTITPEPTVPAINTDSIAGYWSGNVISEIGTGEDPPPSVVGILIISDCAIGNVCGKFSENGLCPGDIILQRIEGERFTFTAETQSGTTHRCGMGNQIIIDLTLLPDGTLSFVNHNGDIHSGILKKAGNSP
ncbi:MAG: hypothetical protein ABUK16_05810 [Anaerolineales bacterium]